MSVAHRRTIGDVVLLELTAASAYALLISLGTGQPDTFFGMADEKLIDLFVPAVQALFALVPLPDGVAETANLNAGREYRHILAACILIACCQFVYSRRHGDNWSEHIKGRLSAAACSPESRNSTALFGLPTNDTWLGRRAALGTVREGAGAHRRQLPFPCRLDLLSRPVAVGGSLFVRVPSGRTTHPIDRITLTTEHYLEGRAWFRQPLLILEELLTTMARRAGVSV